MCLILATDKDAETERNDGARISGEPEKAHEKQEVKKKFSYEHRRKYASNT